MVIQFLNNSDGKTTTFLVDHFIINDEVPYVPDKLVDHRGLSLYLFCKENGMEWNELSFDDTAENFEELERSYFYMFNPIYVKLEIKQRERIKRGKRLY